MQNSEIHHLASNKNESNVNVHVSVVSTFFVCTRLKVMIAIHWKLGVVHVDLYMYSVHGTFHSLWKGLKF